MSATLRLVVDEASLARHAPASPLAVGIELAQQIGQAEQDQALGYFPALDYFRDHAGVDEDLLKVNDALLWLGEQLIRTELRTRLRPVFIRMDSVDIRHHASALPKVRPTSPDALHNLAAHYTPNRFKADISGLLQPHLSAEAASAALLFCLRDSFERAEIVYSALS